MGPGVGEEARGVEDFGRGVLAMRCLMRRKL